MLFKESVSSNWKEGPVKGSGFREFAFCSFSVEKQFCQGGRPIPSGRWKVKVGVGGDGVGTLKTRGGGTD